MMGIRRPLNDLLKEMGTQLTPQDSTVYHDQGGMGVYPTTYTNHPPEGLRSSLGHLTYRECVSVISQHFRLHSQRNNQYNSVFNLNGDQTLSNYLIRNVQKSSFLIICCDLTYFLLSCVSGLSPRSRTLKWYVSRCRLRGHLLSCDRS